MATVYASSGSVTAEGAVAESRCNPGAYEQLIQVFSLLPSARLEVRITFDRRGVQCLPVAVLATTSQHRAVELLDIRAIHRAVLRAFEIKKADTRLSAKIRNSRHSSPPDTSLAYGSAGRDRPMFSQSLR